MAHCFTPSKIKYPLETGKWYTLWDEMKRLLRFFTLTAAVKLSLISLLMGLTHLLRVRSSRGMGLRTLKSLAQALAEPLTAAGAIGALIAAKLNAPYATAAGLFGALLSGIYLLRINTANGNYKAAFGGRPVSNHRAAPTTPPQDPIWLRDVVYHVPRGMQDQTLPPLHCDLWQPPGIERSGFALIYVHGGGYFSSRKDFGTRGFFRRLARQGHVVMDIDYRLAPRADFFEMFSDVLHAVDWMKRNAEDLGANPDKIVLVGGSAGAHLALLAAYAHHQPRLIPLDLQETDLAVRGVISYYGIIDLTAAYRSIQRFASSNNLKRAMMGMNANSLLNHPLAELVIQAGAFVRGVDMPAMREYLRENEDLLIAGPAIPMQTLLGGTPDEIPEIYRLVSPNTYARPGCPPTLLFQGAHDYLLPLEPAKSLHRALRKANVPSVYVELPQTEHTFDLFLAQISPPARVALRHVDRFLAFLDDPAARVVQ